MNNLELETIARYSLQEHKTILDIVQNRPTSTEATGMSKKTFDSALDGILFEQLRTALTSDDSEYLVNPKVSCLRTAILFIQNATPMQLSEICISSGMEALTDTDKEALHMLGRLLDEASYTDEQIFGSSEADDTIEGIRMIIGNAFDTIAALETLYNKITKLYSEALTTSQRIKRFISAELEQEDEAAASEIATLKESIKVLEGCLNGTRQVTFMQGITYPNSNAVCTCGNCGAVNSARDILKAKSFCSDIKSYINAVSYAQDAINGRPVSADISIQQLAARMGYIQPVVCEECGAVNLVSGVFLTLFKEAVQTKWTKTIPSKNNNGAVCIYSAAIVQDLKNIYIEHSDGNDEAIQIFAESLPAIHEKLEDRAGVEIKITDLFSADTYRTYLAELESDISSNVLHEGRARAEYFLRHMINQLHFTTIGSSPIDVIHTLLVVPKLAEIGKDIYHLADEVSGYQDQIAVLKTVRMLLAKDLIGRPIANYQDQILTLNIVTDMLSKARLHSVGEVPSLAEIDIQLHDMKDKLFEVKEKIKSITIALHEKLLALECESCGQYDISEFGLLDLTRASEDAIWISPATERENILISSGVADAMWNILADCYIPMLTQTLFTKLNTIESSRAFFNGILLNKEDAAVKASKAIISALTGVSANKINYASPDGSATKIDAIAKALIIAASNCTSMSDLTAILNISEEALLKQQIDSLPTFEQTETLKYYTNTESLGFGKLSLFSRGYTIDQYSITLCNDTDDTDMSLGEGEAVACAEAAATLFCALFPQDATIPKLSDDLKEHINARCFTAD